MPPSLQKEKNKHQARTEETQAKILSAAEATFSEQGFEKTQLEEVAARAGYTRKEDLFLALMENRVVTKFTAVRREIEAEPEISKRPEIFKHWLATQVSDHAWGTLMLEFKLYALRRPQSRERLQRTYDLLFKSSGSDFIELLFGHGLDKTTRVAIERRLAVMGAIVSAAILESHFRPKLLTKQHLQGVLHELYGALIHA
jgi:AcrR family transcriptional regulator